MRPTHNIEITKLDELHWEIPKGAIPGMHVPAIVIASNALMEKIRQDRTLIQAAGIATLPGIQEKAVIMPDAHEGYGFPIGGVAALDCETGGISPGGIGYDINCGVRLLRTNLSAEEVKPRMAELLDEMFRNVPSGVGSKAKIRVDYNTINEVLERGSCWAVEEGYGTKADLEHTEEGGRMRTADSTAVSEKARRRGMPQVGSLGAGNHFLEVQKVDQIFDDGTARAFGFTEKDQVTVMIHTGSRGLGHQVCSDYLRKMETEYPEIVSKLPDRELIYAPAKSHLAETYLSAMSAAANFAWANRQLITHWVRESFQNVFGKDVDSMGLELVYDVCHNVCKIEEHNGRKCFTHRKGATRAFPKGRPELPSDYRSIGQPVLLPGNMGTASYILVGQEAAMTETFGSTAHGAGRVMSRHAAIRRQEGIDVKAQLASRGILVRCQSLRVVAEEAPLAYKDIDEVARVSHEAGIATRVVRVVPMGVVKG